MSAPTDDDTIDIVLEARRIPMGAKVCMPTGQTRYELLDAFAIYGGDESPNRFAAGEGHRFLRKGKNFQVISAGKPLKWRATRAAIVQALTEDWDPGWSDFEPSDKPERIIGKPPGESK